MKNPIRHYCILSLGGNIGDTSSIFTAAVKSLESEGFLVEKMSPLFQSSPVGCEAEARDFLNAALSGYWTKSPQELLELCQTIEEQNERPKHHAAGQSRTLDIDIILFGDMRISTANLTIPHPRAAERDFVMVPVAEIDSAAARLLCPDYII